MGKKRPEMVIKGQTYSFVLFLSVQTLFIKIEGKVKKHLAKMHQAHKNSTYVIKATSEII